MMASRELPEGAFRAKNGVWCVKKKCERCGREFTAGLVLNPRHCKGCRQVLKNRKYKKTDECRQWESRANSEYGFDEKAALKQGVAVATTAESQAAAITDALPAGQRSGVRQPSEQMDTTCMYDLIAQNEKPGGEAGLRHMP